MQWLWQIVRIHLKYSFCFNESLCLDRLRWKLQQNVVSIRGQWYARHFVACTWSLFPRLLLQFLQFPYRYVVAVFLFSSSTNERWVIKWDENRNLLKVIWLQPESINHCIVFGDLVEFHIHLCVKWLNLGHLYSLWNLILNSSSSSKT